MNLKELYRTIKQANTQISNIIKTINNDKIIELTKYRPTNKKLELYKKKTHPQFKSGLFYKYKNGRIENNILWKICVRK